MRCLVVTTHPLESSLCQALAAHVVRTLEAAGHTVQREDLYGSGFDPRLSASERAGYYTDYPTDAVVAQMARLQAAEAIVLVFPTWWFGFPAMLKGWFDRVWAPGSAYDHADDYGPIRPRLAGLRRMLAVTTLGSPWWVDRLLMRQPLRRVLKTALVGTCAPQCRFRMLSLYRSERMEPARLASFTRRVERALLRWPR
ncbi:NAD(P)H-dependent oxidoreductase [Marilutibacter alkalisoli]|uniref:NAD(P)H-dependent oxidoreductase n=1 Tax=Marilutibacter alkalisoli TaxID=2591633 RepID=A0A514BMY2_9GAMM|nr:NAD(P)H-dependent oxidoreductase [Lysobacter alkalisoli]QDH68730.1 NAD(P)H-dependent oxidoreductase [Lysobacter alkalisoli]